MFCIRYFNIFGCRFYFKILIDFLYIYLDRKGISLFSIPRETIHAISSSSLVWRFNALCKLRRLLIVSALNFIWIDLWLWISYFLYLSCHKEQILCACIKVNYYFLFRIIFGLGLPHNIGNKSGAGNAINGLKHK